MGYLNLNYDTLVYIISFLDPKSIFNLLLTNKSIYNIYLENQSYINVIIADKIIKEIGINVISNNLIKQIISHKNRKQICLQLNQLYELCTVYKRNRFSNYLVLLSYISENCTFLFDKIMNLCIFKFWSNQLDYFDKTLMSTSDIEFILIYGNKKMMNSMLLTNYIPSGVFSYVIRYLLTLQKNKTTNKTSPCKLLTGIVSAKKANYIYSNYKNIIFDCNPDFINYKINKYFKYIIYKNYYNTENKMYMNDILNSVILFNKSELFAKFFSYKNQYKLHFDYQLLINKAIQHDNLPILKLLIKEYTQENINENNTSSKIMIEPKSIYYLVSKGDFNSLRYILKYILGNYINANKYIYSICEGLTDLFVTLEQANSNTTTYTNHPNSVYNKIKKINYLSFYLNLDNRVLINKHLLILQKRLYITNESDIFLLQGHPLTV